MVQTILIIDKHKYDVTKFDHPGDGIKNIYLRDFHNKDVTEEFDYHHYTDYPYELLEKARELGEHLGIKYIGPAK